MLNSSLKDGFLSKSQLKEILPPSAKIQRHDSGELFLWKKETSQGEENYLDRTIHNKQTD